MKTFVLKDTETNVGIGKSLLSIQQDETLFVLSIEWLLKQYPKIMAALDDFGVDYEDGNLCNVIYPLNDLIIVMYSGDLEVEDEEPLYIILTRNDFENLIIRVLNQ